MSAENWRYEYLSSELADNRKRLEDAEKMVKQAKAELEATEWQRNKYKTIVEMLEIAYKVNSSKHVSTVHKEQSTVADKKKEGS